MHRRLNVNVMLGHLRTLQRTSTSLDEYVSFMHSEIWKYTRSSKSAHTGGLLIHRLGLLCNTQYRREPQNLHASILVEHKN